MKKILLSMSLSLAVISLTACVPFSFNEFQHKESPASSSSSDQEIEVINESDFKKLAQVEEKAVQDNEPADPKQKSHQLASAPNGFSRTDGSGKALIDWRYYDIPNTWILDSSRTKDGQRDVTYEASSGDPQIYALLYTLNAYDKSPFDGGKHYADSDLDTILEQDQQKFNYKTTVTIRDKTWHVGLTNSKKDKFAQLTFYYMENTGSFSDSILVGSLVFPLNSDASDFDEKLNTNIGYLKNILEQVTHKVEAQQ
ncbi:hypothetical protein ACFSN5_06015 [Streptococcus tangpeifui]|uniref:hypothetical protein n=1 Tax=Streptococcus tangpeifui TaxID=2709400 RepID=UPI001F15521F|nr:MULTISPECIES: hypothetical protein [unclassified Streptococcus]